ncbi:MAG: ABC transporter ATP-binding protein [Candidatus Eisenbacteria bacterium]
MLRIRNLRRVFRLAGEEIRAIDGIDLSIREGEYLRVIGASGSGKSTLLNLLAALDRPTSGSIETPDGDLSRLSSRALAAWRARGVGMVFQTFNLIPHRSALQNVEIGLLFAGVPRRERLARSVEILGRLGLSGRLHHRPADLSGGEQQRVARARAVVKRPRLLLADEPTGNLDEENAAATVRLLAEQNREGVTVVLVTHDPKLAHEDAHRTVRLHFGRIVETVEHRTERGGSGA